MLENKHVIVMSRRVSGVRSEFRTLTLDNSDAIIEEKGSPATVVWALWYGLPNAAPNDNLNINLTVVFLNITKITQEFYLALVPYSCFELSGLVWYQDPLEINQTLSVSTSFSSFLVDASKQQITGSERILLTLVLVGLNPEVKTRAEWENLAPTFNLSLEIGGTALGSPSSVYSPEINIIKKNLGCAETKNQTFTIGGWHSSVLLFALIIDAIIVYKMRRKASISRLQCLI